MARRGWRRARPCPRRRAGTRRRKRPPVKYTRMGSTGAQVSRLCLGCMGFGGMADWTLSEADSLPIIRKAVECGINFFDTADIRSEEHPSELQSLMRISYAVFCLNKNYSHYRTIQTH